MWHYTMDSVCNLCKARFYKRTVNAYGIWLWLILLPFNFPKIFIYRDLHLCFLLFVTIKLKQESTSNPAHISM
jgi:hypothetical protein